MCLSHASSGRHSSAFTEDQYSIAYPDGVENHFWHVARNHFIRRKLAHLPGTGAILEIGCGRGIVVDFLRKSGYTCYGCEIGVTSPVSEDVSSYLFMGQDAFALEQSFREQISTLLLLDVLEHLKNPHEFLMKCDKEFRQTKYVIITLPARRELWSRYDEFYGHQLRYDIRRTVGLTSHLPVRTIKVGYFFHSLYLPMLLGSLLKKRQVKNRAPSNSISKWIHRIVGTILYIEQYLIPDGLVGSSVYAVVELN